MHESNLSGIYWHRDDYSSVEHNTGTVISENQCGGNEVKSKVMNFALRAVSCNKLSVSSEEYTAINHGWLFPLGY